ncbi:MAG TPA: thioesterase family protein [Gemmatales bacterium]|nr:thioesterase family protein [Gemmatales bacterium]HMP60612.1 thioesterase family protein [Gemmatales bacterium]
MSAVFRTRTRPIGFADTDMAGIVHFSRFFILMEEVEQEFLRSRGLSVIFAEDDVTYGLPRVSAHCDFERPVFFEDVLDAKLWIERLGEKSITYAVEFSKDDQVVAVGRITACCILHGQKPLAPRPLPPRVRAILERE